jgi:hypothetical protein
MLDPYVVPPLRREQRVAPPATPALRTGSHHRSWLAAEQAHDRMNDWIRVRRGICNLQSLRPDADHPPLLARAAGALQHMGRQDAIRHLAEGLSRTQFCNRTGLPYNELAASSKQCLSFRYTGRNENFVLVVAKSRGCPTPT